VAVGDATFASTGSGEDRFPTTALKRWSLLTDKVLYGGRWRTQHDTRMLGVSRDHISVSPFEGGRRGGESGSGSRCQKVQLTSVSGSQHPCSAEPRLLIGLREWEAGEAGVHMESQLDDS
jgi:hypothetical protein